MTLRDDVMASLPVLQSGRKNFSEILNGNYAAGGYFDILLVNYLHTVITT
jgi:hypothetical protein